MPYAVLDAALGRFARYRRLRGGCWSHARAAKHGRLLTSLRCRLRGHDAVLVPGPTEIYLRCCSCGWESAGWRLG